MIDFALSELLFIDQPIDAYIQEIDILFNTDHTELIGDTDYGTSFEDYLWRLEPTESELYNYILTKLQTTFFYNYFPTEIEVEKLDGTERSIFCIRLSITYDKKEKPKIKTYIYK